MTTVKFAKLFFAQFDIPLRFINETNNIIYHDQEDITVNLDDVIISGSPWRMTIRIRARNSNNLKEFFSVELASGDPENLRKFTKLMKDVEWFEGG